MHWAPVSVSALTLKFAATDNPWATFGLASSVAVNCLLTRAYTIAWHSVGA